MRIDVKLHAQELAGFYAKLAPEIVHQSTVDALNRSLTTGKKALKDAMVNMYGIKSSQIEKIIKTYKANKGSLSASLYLSDKQLSFSDKTAGTPKWNAKRSGNTILGYVKKDSPVSFTRTFLATMPSGHRGMFERVGSKAYPIKEVKGPSISHLVGSEFISDKVKDIMLEMFDKRFVQQIHYRLNK